MSIYNQCYQRQTSQAPILPMTRPGSSTLCLLRNIRSFQNSWQWPWKLNMYAVNVLYILQYIILCYSESNILYIIIYIYSYSTMLYVPVSSGICMLYDSRWSKLLYSKFNDAWICVWMFFSSSLCTDSLHQQTLGPQHCPWKLSNATMSDRPTRSLFGAQVWTLLFKSWFTIDASIYP